MLGAAAILVALAPAPAASALPGIYRSQQAEVGAALELTPDHRFRYQLDYGAVSETGAGKWSSDGTTVRLTSDPMPRAPSFAVVRDDPAPKGELWVQLEDPGFDWGGPIEMLLKIPSINAWVRAEPNDRGRVDVGQNDVRAIRPIVPVYELLGPPLELTPGRGHRLTLRFFRNDLGQARFVDQPLAIDGDGLTIERYDTSIRFRRVGPPLKKPAGE